MKREVYIDNHMQNKQAYNRKYNWFLVNNQPIFPNPLPTAANGLASSQAG